MGGYYEVIDDEIIHKDCIDCYHARLRENGTKYCHITGYDINEDSDACDRFAHADC